MATASKTTATKSTAAKATATKATAQEGRVVGHIYANEIGQIFRESDGGLVLLWSPTPESNIHPRQFSAEDYEVEVLRRFGVLTQIYPV